MRSDTPSSLRTGVLLAAVLAVGAFPPAVAQSYKVLHTFGSGTDGSVPSGPPSIDAKGRLAGNTYDGGTGICSDYGCGMTYALLPQPDGEWKEIPLHEFTGTNDGATPLGNIVADNKGNLYSTESGGGGGQGAVFELSRISLEWNLAPVYGPYFSPGLLLDAIGNLYGFFGQGDLGSGAIGELSPGPSGWTYTQLYSFCSQQGCPDGVDPKSPLSWDWKGNLYGTTLFGGNVGGYCFTGLGCGVAFQMTPNGDGTWTYRVMHRFASSAKDGQSPYTGLVLDASGNAYGATQGGGPT